ncbi:hypothetical protein B0H19DRAFT_1233095, partial [Mycena capillaripes]
HNSTTHFKACSTKFSSQFSLWLWYRASLASLRSSLSAILPVALEQGDICVRTGFVTSSFVELVVPLLDFDHDIRQILHAKTHSGGEGILTRLWTRHIHFSSLGTRPQLVETNEKPKNNGIRDGLTARHTFEGVDAT